MAQKKKLNLYTLSTKYSHREVLSLLGHKYSHLLDFEINLDIEIQYADIIFVDELWSKHSFDLFKNELEKNQNMNKVCFIVLNDFSKCLDSGIDLVKFNMDLPTVYSVNYGEQIPENILEIIIKHTGSMPNV
jgi:hypothetical protein